MQFTSAKQAKAARAAPAPPMLILILEDERLDRHRLARMCSSLSFESEISNATNLREFEVTLEEEDFGLILLDYSLPDGTGLDALEMVRLSARNLSTPTLMISGMAHGKVADEAQLAGCAGFLSKDALTKALFSDAVKDLLTPSVPTIPQGQNTFTQKEMAGFLAQATRRNTRDIKPMVSRMLRQLRALRASDDPQDGVTLQAVEQNCMSLWAFLIELERESGTAILSEMNTEADLAADLSGTAENEELKSRKPPSPFGRTRH